MKNCIGGAWHTIIGTVTGEQYLMGCILPSGEVNVNANVNVNAVGLSAND